MQVPVSPEVNMLVDAAAEISVRRSHYFVGVEHLFEAMAHDKKNDSKALNFTLLSNIGDLHLDQLLYLDHTNDKAILETSLDYLRDTMGI